jgi:hypothetical protein
MRKKKKEDKKAVGATKRKNSAERSTIAREPLPSNDRNLASSYSGTEVL